MVRKCSKIISSDYIETIRFMDETLPVDESFDMIKRNMIIGGKNASFYFIDGFMKDEAMLKIMDSFLSVTDKDMP